MKQPLLIAAAALIGVIPAETLAQSCRTNFGGAYTAPHSGVKPDGNPFVTTAFFDFNPAGTFNVHALIVEPSTTFPVAVFSKWWWVGPCDIAIDRSAFIGRLNSDGSFGTLEANDEESLTGYLQRDSINPDRSVAQANGSEGAFSETLFGRVFADSFARQVTSRVAALRDGAYGFSVAPVRLGDMAFASAGRPINERIGGFVSGQLVTGNRNYLPDEGSRSFTVGGATAGFDYRIDAASAVGIVASYFTGGLGVFGGKTNASGGMAGMYGTTQSGPFYVDGYAGGGITDYRTSRTITYGGLSYSATGTPSGSLIAAGGNVGYRFKRDAVRWGPVGELRFNRVSIEGYNETGELGAAIQPRDSNSLQSGLGAEFAFDLPTKLGVMSPHLRATWRHEFLDAKDAAIADFLASPGTPITVTSAILGRDYLALTAGIVGRQLGPGLFVSLDYTGELGRINQVVHQVSLAARIAF